jgi:glycerol uptake facilitator-like aquaporin
VQKWVHKEKELHLPLWALPWLGQQMVKILAEHDGTEPIDEMPTIPTWATRGFSCVFLMIQKFWGLKRIIPVYLESRISINCILTIFSVITRQMQKNQQIHQQKSQQIVAAAAAAKRSLGYAAYISAAAAKLTIGPAEKSQKQQMRTTTSSAISSRGNPAKMTWTEQTSSSGKRFIFEIYMTKKNIILFFN